MNKKKATVVIAGEIFKAKRKHFAFESLYKEVQHMKEFKKLVDFTNLETVSLNGTNINDEGLKYLSNCNTIHNLNLTFTPISDKGISYLTNLENLEYLRLKETDITDKSIPYFNKMSSLKELQIHETYISTQGLLNLNNKSIEEIFFSHVDTQKDIDNLKQLSAQLSNCKIIIKSQGHFFKGIFESNG